MLINDLYNNKTTVAESAEDQLPLDTLNLIDEYIAKVEPEADRNQMIQHVVDGSIHTSELEYALQDDKPGVTEGAEGKVVFSGTGANGGKYEIIQSSPTDFMIHANGKHIDTYGSLQRAMSVLKNEVPGLQQGMAEGSQTPSKFEITYKTKDGTTQTKMMIGKDEQSVSKYFEFKFRHKPISIKQVEKQGVAEGMKAHELSQYCEELVAEKGWDAAYKHALMMANMGRDPAWNGVLKYLDAMKQGMAEGSELRKIAKADVLAKAPKPRNQQEYDFIQKYRKDLAQSYKSYNPKKEQDTQDTWNILPRRNKGMAEGFNFDDKKGRWEWDDGTSYDVSQLTPAQKERVAKWKAANPGKRQGRPMSGTRGENTPHGSGAGPRVMEQGVAEAVGMMIKGAVISGANDQDIADRIAAKTGGRVDSGSYGHHVLITYPTTQHRAEAAVKIRKMFPGIELYKSGGNRNAIDEQGMAEGSELKKAKRAYNQAARDANADQVGAGKKIDTMKNSLRQRDLNKQGVAEGSGPVTHRIGLTVTDPNHPMVSKRKEPYQKSVRITQDVPDREAAINQAIAHHRRKGYKVHDHHYIGTVDEGIDIDPALAAVAKKYPSAHISKDGKVIQKSVDRPYTPPQQDAEKQQRDLTAKYPNIDDLVAAAERNRDPYYDRAEGNAYYAGREAEQNYQKLKQIQRVIQGLNESLDRSHLP